jgi:hypothetical protein
MVHLSPNVVISMGKWTTALVDEMKGWLQNSTT